MVDSWRPEREATQILLDYWDATGKQLKDYRDVDQHFGNLTQRYFMQTSPIQKILVQFPDNPETKSLKRFSYEKNINGIEFLQKAFIDITNTLDRLAELYGATKEAHKMSVSLAQLGDLLPASDRTLSFSFEKSFSNIGGKALVNISGFGMDQLSDMRVSVRKYFLDEETLAKASKLYQGISDS